MSTTATGQPTYVSNPAGATIAPPSGAPGATGPASTMGVDKAAVVFVLAAVGGLVGLRLLLGKGADLPPMRIDAMEGIKVFMLYQTINIPLKLLAYHYHGHAASQAYLLFA